MKILSIFAILLSFLLVTTPVLAHLRGVPIAKINGQFTKVHPVQAVTSFVFDLPTDADIAPQNYVVKQKLDFELDLTKLPYPPEIFKDMPLIWDFGDGKGTKTTTNSSKISYSYTKTGTFVMQVTADLSKAGFEDVGKLIIQATVINILPNKDYKLPKPVIKLNDMEDPKEKSYEVDLNNKVTFDASNSWGTGKIVSYQWNFDDGEESNRSKATHRYKLPQFYATPVLRITDEHGFFTDEFVTIRNSGKNEPNDPEAEERRALLLMIGGGVLFFVLIGGIGFGIYALKHTKNES